MLRSIKILLVVAIMLAIVNLPSEPARADEAPMVFVNGSQVCYDVPPVIVEGRILVPFRQTFEALGALRVDWMPDQQCGKAVFPGIQCLYVFVGNSTAYMDDRAIYGDVPTQIIDGRVMVPLRTVAEACFCKVSYDAETQTVDISSGTGLKSFAVVQGLDSVTKRGIRGLGCEYLKNFSVYSESIFAEAEFTGPLSKEIKMDWFFIENGEKQLVSSCPVAFSVSNVAYSTLPKEQYRLGSWVVALTIDGNEIQPFNFNIVQTFSLPGYSELYSTKVLPFGYYAGYANGYSVLKTNDGITIRGTINDMGLGHGNWNYPDGSSFYGDLRSEPMCENPFSKRKTQQEYHVKGTFTSNNGEAKYIEAHTTYDTSFRFGQLINHTGSFSLTNGKYEGYLSNGKPQGGGKITLDNGTVFEGRIEGWATLWSLDQTFSNIDLLDSPDYEKLMWLDGEWHYPDGSIFIGSFQPQFVSESRDAFLNGKYKTINIVYGELFYPNGTRKTINGYTSEYDPLYRFDKFNAVQGNIYDDLRNGKISTT